jgi:hypothetical protein
MTVNPETFNEAFVQDANATEAEILAVCKSQIINHFLLNDLAF